MIPEKAKKKPRVKSFTFRPEQIQVSQAHVYNYQKAINLAQSLDKGGLGITGAIGRRTILAIGYDESFKNWSQLLEYLIIESERKQGLTLYFSKLSMTGETLYIAIPEFILEQVRAAVYLTEMFNLVRITPRGYSL